MYCHFFEVHSCRLQAINELSKSLKFAFNNRFGFITFCPSNLGTTLRASVHARVPFLSSLPNFNQICEKYSIQARGTHGEHTASVGGVYDLSNKRRLGLTEIDAVTEMYNGVRALLDLEKQLASYNKDVPGAYNPRAICPRTGEAECYSTFVDYLDAVICDYHDVKDPAFKHPAPTFGDLEHLPFGNVDPTGKFVISTRVRVGRSVQGFLFPTIIGKEDRLKLESTIANALTSLTGEHAGTYYPLSNI
ncbi:hypothetical protein AHF37_09079 [Paragonimus kellicotti]|nr:hypothetical protein AHF37_09079 [Paragonimus kellicotti]